jgi:hypothetical protein
MEGIRRKLAAWLVRFLNGAVHNYEPFSVSSRSSLRVEGNLRFSTAIMQLPRSAWPHAALHVGSNYELPGVEHGTPALLEADLEHGVVKVPLAKLRISIRASAALLASVNPARRRSAGS